MNWEAVSAVSTLVASATVIVSAPLLLYQLIESRRARQFESTIRLLETISNPEARRRRAELYECSPDERGIYDRESVLLADDVLGPLDTAWLLIEEGHINQDLVIGVYGNLVIRIWDSVKPIVDQERSKRGPTYRRRAEMLVNQAKIERSGERIS
jgi:hypothetical protein